jgi:hypothetical protein
VPISKPVSSKPFIIDCPLFHTSSKKESFRLPAETRSLSNQVTAFVSSCLQARTTPYSRAQGYACLPLRATTTYASEYPVPPLSRAQDVDTFTHTASCRPPWPMARHELLDTRAWRTSPPSRVSVHCRSVRLPARSTRCNMFDGLLSETRFLCDCCC